MRRRDYSAVAADSLIPIGPMRRGGWCARARCASYNAIWAMLASDHCTPLITYRIRHQRGIDFVGAPSIVPLPQALPLEPEPLVQLNRRLVPREHVQLELPNPRAARPLDRRLQ